MRSHFDEFNRMADRMMAGFGMPKMDISNFNLIINLVSVMPFGVGKDPFSEDPFFAGAGSGFGRMDQMMKDMRKDMKMAMSSNMARYLFLTYNYYGIHFSLGSGAGNGHFVQ